jgi:Matrixin
MARRAELNRQLSVIIFLSLFLSSCAGPAIGGFKAQTDCGMLRSPGGVELSWQALPIFFVLDESVPESKHEEIREAARRWNDLVDRDIIFIMESTEADVATRVPNVNVISYVGSDWQYQPTISMLTLVVSLGREIQSTDILINSFYHFDSPPEEFIEIMMHEMGHALGLEHSEVKENLMYPSVTRGIVKDLSLSRDSFLCGYK